ncbi:TetR/AcrR family transcriptional regulator [Pseudomaricurvus alkylphenolicus]|jgi:AcrR family transcriptional regulator|uniref:TetR/AcrR family transcriptional regulator n=1 Tax=Pseudomaricurvus alkylphenolicus TaxID=1306991 RepID=UPI00141FA1BA|nr:TetR/AcrR family transcriptional regulator [Pseudomaricurvus alkylphenolicus]NIB40664.1 TetR/AcrR family transcriptional regulator [Pseudomaricurvus alkylphenolicus]
MSGKSTSSSKTTTKARRSHNRVQPLLDAAAKLFATKGYKETTMRDIGSEIGMLPGSVYYHFKSKQELLLAVYEQAVTGIKTRLLAAIADEQDPWRKLEVAVVTHTETILDQNDYAHVMIGVLPDKAPEIQQELTALRDGYEAILIELIDELPVRKGIDRKLLRLMLLGAINSTQIWYQEGTISPEEIARTFVGYIKDPVAK